MKQQKRRQNKETRKQTTTAVVVQCSCALFFYFVGLFLSVLFCSCVCVICAYLLKDKKAKEWTSERQREREYLHSAQGAEKQCSSIFLLYHACTAHITKIYIRRKRETEKKITSISPCIILLPFSNLNNWYTQVEETKWERERTMRSATTSQKSHFGVLYVYIL